MQVQYNRNRLMDNVQQKILCYAERYLHSKGTCKLVGYTTLGNIFVLVKFNLFKHQVLFFFRKVFKLTLT